MNILLIGSFDGYNWGDNLVLEAILKSISKSFHEKPKFYIPTSNPNYIEKYKSQYEVIPIDINLKRTFSFRFLNLKVIRVLKEVDFVFTTAGILFADHFFDPRKNFISSLIPLLFFKPQKAKVIGYFVGITTYKNRFQKYVLKNILNQHDLIITRDQNSYKYLVNLGYKSISHSGADIVHYIFRNIYIKPGERKRIGLNFSSYLFKIKGTNSLKEFNSQKNIIIVILNQLYQKFGNKIVLISTSAMDDKINRIIANELGAEFYPVYKNGFEDNIKIFNNFRFFIGTRLHSCIFSTSLGIPTISINYNEKVKSFFEDIGFPSYCLEWKNFLHKDYFMSIVTEVENNNELLRKRLSDVLLYRIRVIEKKYL